MKVLAIGNSFSNDAMRYLHGIAKADGVDMKTVNLFIGGCPLSRHYANIHNDAADYDFEFNGVRTAHKSVNKTSSSKRYLGCCNIATSQFA